MSAEKKKLLCIKAEESGERIDALLAQCIEELSRSGAQRLIAEGNVERQGTPVKKNYICRSGDEFSVYLPETKDVEIEPQDIPLDIIYEDKDIIVVNKQRGLVVHPAPGHADQTLVNALLFHCGDSLSGIGGERRPGIVHRIDKDTSGLIIAAKNDAAHMKLTEQLADHSISRIYECVVCGGMREEEGTIDAPIGRSSRDRKKMAVTPTNSKNAITHWKVIQRYQKYTHVQCRLETGRTHQIRVHMAYTGHPLLGDGVYGAASPDKGLEGQCLHAKEIMFIHPETGEPMHFVTDLPEYFTSVISKLGLPK